MPYNKREMAADNIFLLLFIPLVVLTVYLLRSSSSLFQQRHRAPGSGEIAGIQFFLAFWLIAWLAEGMVQGDHLKEIFSRSGQLFLILVLPGLWLFLMRIEKSFFPEKSMNSRRVFGVISLFPAGLQFLDIFFPGAILQLNPSPLAGMIGWLPREPGSLYYFFQVTAYSTILGLSLYLALLMTRKEIPTIMGIGRLSILLVVAAGTNLLGIFRLLPAPWPKFIFAYTLVGAVVTFSIRRYRAYLLTPSSVGSLLQTWSQPLIIFDHGSRLVFRNTKSAMVGFSDAHLGLTPQQISKTLGWVDTFLQTPQGSVAEISWAKDTWEVRQQLFPFSIFGLPGRMVFFNPVTDRIQQAEELEIQVQNRTQDLTRAHDRLQSELDRRIKTEAELYYLSAHDLLTGLVNQGFFNEELIRTMERHRRNSASLFTLIFVDFDGFKQINDTHGHMTGDTFLKEMGSRFSKAVRGSDTVARFGGDEFLVLLTDLGTPEEGEEVAERIFSELTIPLVMGEHTIFPSASFGLVHADVSYQKPQDYIRDADIAMYHSKTAGKGRITRFEESMRLDLLTQRWLLEDLRRGMEEGGIRLHFQAIVDMASEAVIGYEVLVRCTDRHGQEIPPPVLIRTAEENGLGVALGSLILRRACETLHSLRIQRPQLKDLWISVNVSAAQITDPDFVQLVSRILADTDLPLGTLHLEITETGIISDFERVLPVLEELKKMGMHIKLDDFGTGYSSLSYLHRLPADCLKIDRSFVLGLEAEDLGIHKKGTESIIRAIVALGQELGYTILVEGLETKAQVVRMKALGCQQGQGFHFAKPISAAKLLHEEEPVLESLRNH